MSSNGNRSRKCTPTLPQHIKTPTQTRNKTFGKLVGKASIGPRTKLYWCNTVGTAKENGEPEIGADVILGAGARVFGPIIGANAVVLCTYPSQSKLMGIPA
jgi:serine acetyltransferase